ncbi:MULTISPECIES: biotin--[acetyl-CoA-carboxylase] ligase [Flavobacteriaceae]|uniref:Biotin--[acetyl-CoA-carboxylase] ligase n=1 Tax=Flagellimonas alvinocaridis TaxID=2530200 RepID=A0A4S8RV51_9FLAO|nr:MULTISPECIES: biotin--[acetyl-CoA-carboxylase] ligase [Allomuricauda]MDC6361189.1 biotin--[acetyl-CoA-carboxylase] ligase [Muricauda sp. SP22]THV59119.1 biotin--[acetyl-CoA-carboxylase] ligase [Allomuricauda alvinocaridis]
MGELSRIIKLDATDSTNQYLKDLLQTKNAVDSTVVVAKKQLRGRGQMGAVWESEDGKNLTFSVLKSFDLLHVEHQFNLNLMVSLAVCDVLNQFSLPDVRVKWPNDILSGSSKICGILIENILKGQLVQHSIIGIGLNVNQTSFDNLGNAASLKMISGRTFDLDELLQMILERIRIRFLNIQEKTVNQLLPEYEQYLFRKDKPSTFKDAEGAMFMGFIRGVSDTGKLVLELEDRVFQEFDLKEISLLY